MSNYGRIKNKNNRLLKLSIDNNGYYNVQNKSVHIIVAKIFINNENNLNIVNHIDGNKLNNNSNNLEWITQQNNSIHAINTGLRKNIKKILHIDDNGILLNEYNSCAEAARILNVNCRSINKCCKNELKSCGENKYKFKFKDENTNNNLQIENNIKLLKKNKNIKKVIIYNKNLEIIEICKSISETSKKYNINTKTIVNHCDGKIKYSNGNFIFKYSL